MESPEAVSRCPCGRQPHTGEENRGHGAERLSSVYRQVRPTSAYGRYHNLRDVARQAFDAPRPLDSCSVMRRGGTGLMRRDRVAGLSGW